jgi:hypothetical protein
MTALEIHKARDALIRTVQKRALLLLLPPILHLPKNLYSVLETARSTVYEFYGVEKRQKMLWNLLILNFNTRLEIKHVFFYDSFSKTTS